MLEIIEKKLSDLAQVCGLKLEVERNVDPVKEMKNQILDDTKGAVPLSELLLYDYYDTENNIAFNKDTLGTWFEINPLVGSNESIEKNLTLFFNEELPSGGVMQFLIVASHDISEVLNLWEEGRNYGGEAVEKLTRYRKHFLMSLARDYKNAGDGRVPRNFRTFVTYSNKNTGEKSIDEMIKFQRKLINKLRAEDLNPRICNAQDLIDVTREILQMELVEPKTELSKNSKKENSNNGNKVIYNRCNKLSDQILDFCTSHTITEDTIYHNKTGLASKILAPASIPISFSLNEMIKLLGNEKRSIPGRFIISYSLANNLGTAGASKLISRGNRVIHASRKHYARDDLLTQEEAGQWINVKAIHKDGEIFLTESMQVMITAPREDIEIAEEVIKSLYNTQNWKLEPCRYIQRITTLALLPMMPICYWDSLKFFRLTRNALSGEVTAKLPIQGEWKGVPMSGLLLMGRRGQAFNFNPFYRIGGGGNYNICMMAPPGSGKSFLLEGIVESMLATDVAVFVMDIGGSYENICTQVSGEMIRFNKETDLSLNPFATLSSSGAIYAKAIELMKKGKSDLEISEVTGLSKEKIEALKVGKQGGGSKSMEFDGIELLEIEARDNKSKNTYLKEKNKNHFVTKDSVIYAKSMVAAMCGVSGMGREEAIIERAIVEGIAAYGNKLDITKMSETLENLRDNKGNMIQGASQLADSLYSYTEGGIHGRFFKSSDKTASFKSMMTVFELEELVNDEPLLAVILQVILMQITMQFLCGDRTRRFILIVDEAWMILDYAANFLERFARTVRKYGGSLVVCTQDLTSFSNECGTRKSQSAILECSTWKLILQQKEEGLQAFSKSKAYEKYLGLIESIKKCADNKYSEVLINTDGATVVGRFATDPYMTAMFSTEDKDFAYLKSRARAGISKHNALLELSKKYGELPSLDVPSLDIPSFDEEKK